MGDLAEKYHSERDKNRILVSELHRMNETLQRFESRINSLQKEKRALATDLETLKEKQTLSNKLQPNIASEAQRSYDRREQFEQTNHHKVVFSEPDCRNQYSHFVRDVVLSEKTTPEERAYERREDSRSLGRPELPNPHQYLMQSDDRKEEDMGRKHHSNSDVHALSRQQPLQHPSSGKDLVENSRDYYNSHVLRSLERFAQKTVEDKKAQNNNTKNLEGCEQLSSKT